MNESPVVSIVLPVWNGERYLPAALDSVLAQTYGDFELVAVDDGSCDGTASILTDYAKRDSRIRCFRNETNLKLPASLNRGFAEARGRYLTWTSDDNILHSDFLAVLTRQIEESGADIVYSDCNIIDAEGRLMAVRHVGLPSELVFANNIGASFLYRREVHETLGGFDRECFLYEDYDFWVRAFLAGLRFHRIAAAPFDYRRHPGSLSSRHSVPQAYIDYRYEVRNKADSVDRASAYVARELLIRDFRHALGGYRYLRLLAEAFCIKPANACGLVRELACRAIGKKCGALKGTTNQQMAEMGK